MKKGCFLVAAMLLVVVLGCCTAYADTEPLVTGSSISATQGAVPVRVMISITASSSVRRMKVLSQNGAALGGAESQTQNADGTKTFLLDTTFQTPYRGTLCVQFKIGEQWVDSDVEFDVDYSTSAATDSQESTIAPASIWPQETLTGKSVYVYPLPLDERYQSRTGPDRSYHGGGAYKTYKIESMEALFIEDGYAYVEMTYSTVDRRRLYFATKIFESLSGVPEKTLTGYPAETTAPITPRFGPGNRYDDFEEAAIRSGKKVKVFFEEDGWVFAEFDTSKLGMIRAWLPAEDVKPN